MPCKTFAGILVVVVAVSAAFLAYAASAQPSDPGTTMVAAEGKKRGHGISPKLAEFCWKRCGKDTDCYNRCTRDRNRAN